MGAYDPIALEVMRVALDEAWRCVPERERTRHRHKDMASRLLEAAGEGERDPKRLKQIALDEPRAPDWLEKQVAAHDALKRERMQSARRGSKRS